MSELINPNTGAPVTKPVTRKEMEEVQQAIRALDQFLYSLNGKLEALIGQHIQLGLFTQYTINSLLSLENEDGTAALPVDMEAFPAYAEEEMKKMREQAKAHVEEMRKKEKTAVEDIKVNLDD